MPYLGSDGGGHMIEVLRIGHRPSRDKRITTHVGLVARAFGAQKIYIPGNDGKIKETLMRVISRFGGDFGIDVRWKTKEVLNQHSGITVHLTMYGMSLMEGMDIISGEHSGKDILIIVGATKVPAYIYEIADLNISVGNQPHSEIAALSMFLDRLSEGRWIEKDFHGKLKIVPHGRKKIVLEADKHRSND